MLNRKKRVDFVAKKQHYLIIKLTGIFTLSVLLAVKISFEGFGKVNDSIIFFVALYNRLGFLFSKKSSKTFPFSLSVMIILMVPCSRLFIDCKGYDCVAILFI